MAKRNTPYHRGILARPIDPWREDVIAALDQRRCQLLLELGIDPNDSDADARAIQELPIRHGTRDNADILSSRSASRAFFALAAASVPGFGLMTRRYNMGSIYASRHPRTRLPDLPLADIAVLVRAVNEQSQTNVRGRRSGIKKAINALTEPGQAFSHLRRHRHRLEWMYHRHRHKVPPSFPSLALCARPDRNSCFGSDVLFDEAPSLCRARRECAFWRAWEEWANYNAEEYRLEMRALVAIEAYRRLTSRRRRSSP